MKNKIILGTVLAMTFFTSCKNENPTINPNDSQNQQEVLNDYFIVTVDVIVKKDDDFQIYYTEKTSADFNEQESLWVKVKGSETSQKVVFNLPNDVVPSLFRLDFGLNKEQEDIKLNSVEVNYLGKKFLMNGPEQLSNYFRPEANTVIDLETDIIKAIVKDGIRVEPVLYPHEVPMERELKKLVL